MHEHTHPHAHTHTHTHARKKHTHTHKHTHMNTHTNTHTRTHANTHTHIHTHTHTHTHIHTHEHASTCFSEISNQLCFSFASSCFFFCLNKPLKWVKKGVVVLPFQKKDFSFLFWDDWKCFGSVLKNSDAKYNVDKIFQLHLWVVVTGAWVAAESSSKQKPREWMTSPNDSWLVDHLAKQSLTN